jgi:molybdate transport system substrate-binding protein
MEKLTTGGFTTGATQTVFAHNKLEIVVGTNNPKHIASLADLAKPGVIYISAGPTVPAGKYALQALAKAGVKVTPKSLETDVKSVVSKVQLGEADAVSGSHDGRRGDREQGPGEIPDQHKRSPRTPSPLSRTPRTAGDRERVIAFVKSPEGQAILPPMGSSRPERAPVWIVVPAALGAAFFIRAAARLVVRTPGRRPAVADRP